MKRLLGLWILLAMLLCSGCGGLGLSEKLPPAETKPPATPPLEAPPALELPKGDTVLFTLEAKVDDGKVLRLESVGKKRTDRDVWDVREVRVYDGETLVQTILAQEAIAADGVSGSVGEGYTECWSPEEAMTVRDMNFDSQDDLDLFGWIPNNTIPHYYWLWDSEAGQYRYGFCLQGAETDPERQAVVSQYKYQNGIYYTDHYQYDESGTLTLVRRDVEDWLRGSQEQPLLETYAVRDGQLTLVEEGHLG